ncbi:hypothetical protein RF11_00093 [Thelohanellus kitauei]|uniref:Uncharacterized protein n=1 Tax=Thelohanellus kitauei TaxID=669202 RepID=A0A0C2NAW5_THEKT|nr:hypothetical protein RF11_00093 [Thelohanellus kitauei]
MKQTVMYGQEKTNNVIEGCYNSFSKSLGLSHPNIWKFLKAIQKEQNLNEFKLAQADAGAKTPQGRIYRDITLRIENIIRKVLLRNVLRNNFVRYVLRGKVLLRKVMESEQNITFLMAKRHSVSDEIRILIIVDVVNNGEERSIVDDIIKKYRRTGIAIKSANGGAIRVKLTPSISSMIVELMNDNVTQSVIDIKNRLNLSVDDTTYPYIEMIQILRLSG